MTKTKQTEARDSDEGLGRDQLNALISAAVLRALGKPDDLRAVSVRRLWGDNYRVNVLIGAEVTSALIAHSYFLTADGSGTILEASPLISKQY